MDHKIIHHKYNFSYWTICIYIYILIVIYLFISKRPSDACVYFYVNMYGRWHLFTYSYISVVVLYFYIHNYQYFVNFWLRSKLRFVCMAFRTFKQIKLWFKSYESTKIFPYLNIFLCCLFQKYIVLQGALNWIWFIKKQINFHSILVYYQ